jgi:hypothetical protein
MAFHVYVSAEDIANGIKGDATNCAIALALKKISDEDVEVEVPGVMLGSVRYTLPKEAEEFVDKFDNGMGVEPIEFDMEEIIPEMEEEEFESW